MTMLFMDGFDHYGTGSTSQTNMQSGPYSLTNGSVQTYAARTGTCGVDGAFLNGGMVRRLDSPETRIGLGFAGYLSVPVDNGVGGNFRDFNNSVCLSWNMLSSGGFAVYDGNGTQKAINTAPIISGGAWYHYEVFAYLAPIASTGTGSFELKVNGTTVLYITGVNWLGQSGHDPRCDAVGWNCRGYSDDVFCYNCSGTYNNGFIGDRKVATLFPNADTATADWHLNGASTGYGCINDAAPDGDSTYLAALATDPLPVLSGFGLDNLSSAITSINAIQTYSYSKKTSTGPATVATDLVSSGTTALGATVSPTVNYVYNTDMIELDPNTGAPWTNAGVNAAQIKLRRIT